MTSRIARMPKATVATRSPKKYSGRWNCILLVGFGVSSLSYERSGCGLPAFEPNQPDKESADAHRHGDAKEPERDHAQHGWPIAVSPFHVLIGIHQVTAFEAGRDVRGITRHLLRFELGHARLQLGVVRHQRVVASRVHVVAVMVGPPGAV